MFINKNKFLTLVIDNPQPLTYTSYYNKNVMFKDKIVGLTIYIGGRQRVSKVDKILNEDDIFKSTRMNLRLDSVIKQFSNRRKNLFYTP